MSLKSDTHDARIVRMRMGMLCRAHLDKTFIAGAEQTALWQEHANLALMEGKPAPDLPVPSKFQKIRAGETDIYVYLPEEHANEAFGLGAKYQKMEMTAPKAIEAMQALANQISYYDLRLKEPFQVMNFLREELASQDVPESGEEGSLSTPTDPEAGVR
ncbi:hypothetical protein [Limnohabitans sp. Rim28]|uniref:hypothetical protein n=1 Tax=Limnohabitans sp. Rim28 TaxID=1100720 RepID=UPI0010572430|nr:hypothetical protein [Limnohabitans sp. Rim28]